MIVSPGRGYVFVHAPKTGGTALTLALEARAHRDDIIVGDTPKAKARRRRIAGVTTAGRLWKHSKLRDIRGLLPDATLDGLRPVTLVRNPWDRMISYYHWLRDQTFDHPAVRLARAVPFGDFVLDDATAASFRANPYTSYVEGGRDPLFVRLEHLAADLAPFEDLLGFRLDVPRANESDRPDDWRALYDARTTRRVAEICAADISAFSYRFDPGDSA
ncbi:sulfotransferase family 2 domain-containing protein [Jannaschia aquimarina]|uniref:Sulfotransferase family protein n=1 Tax=Jannaschia aquimarina TaxID=935700 RepID=A0A0D1EKL5_9RHOB|nr:sulfotransferase family 2 domain-containing protein [Jannaschia aquimarina]KIT18139.1 Sulfotransferase family protein [Jannaschia aquimarina]SNT30297.1 Sulfotransferase family protein [Jannaschia aquimarina]